MSSTVVLLFVSRTRCDHSFRTFSVQFLKNIQFSVEGRCWRWMERAGSSSKIKLGSIIKHVREVCVKLINAIVRWSGSRGCYLHKFTLCTNSTIRKMRRTSSVPLRNGRGTAAPSIGAWRPEFEKNTVTLLLAVPTAASSERHEQFNFQYCARTFTHVPLVPGVINKHALSKQTS